MDIGANDDALALYSDDQLVNMKQDGELSKLLSLVSNPKETTVEPINISMPMKEIALKLGLPENATQEQILTTIGGLQEQNRTLKAEKEAAGVKSIELAVDQAVSAGKVSADKSSTSWSWARKSAWRA